MANIGAAVWVTTGAEVIPPRDKWSNVTTNCGSHHTNFRGQGTKQAPQRQERDANAICKMTVTVTSYSALDTHVKSSLLLVITSQPGLQWLNLLPGVWLVEAG